MPSGPMVGKGSAARSDKGSANRAQESISVSRPTRFFHRFHRAEEAASPLNVAATFLLSCTCFIQASTIERAFLRLMKKRALPLKNLRIVPSTSLCFTIRKSLTSHRFARNVLAPMNGTYYAGGGKMSQALLREKVLASEPSACSLQAHEKENQVA